MNFYKFYLFYNIFFIISMYLLKINIIRLLKYYGCFKKE